MSVPSAAFRRQIIVLIPVYMNTLMVGCSSGWFANALYYFMLGEEVHATSLECALILSMTEIGRMAFAIPAGILADKYGRKMATVSASVLDVVAWLSLSFDTSIHIIYVARFIIGVSQGLKYATSLIMIGEIASPEIRGKLASIYRISMNVGLIATSLLSVLFSSYKWLTSGVAFLSMLTLLSMFWATETPSFLISASKPKQAKRNLHRIREGYSENERNDEFEKLQKYIENEKAQKKQTNLWTFVKSKPIRKPLLTGILANFFTVATGSLFIRGYVTSIIPANDIVPNTFYPLANQILTLLGATATAFYVEKVPRRTIFMFGAATMTVFNAFCALSHYFIAQGINDHVFSWLFTLGNMLALICYSSTLQAMLNTLNSELYPQALKGLCGSLSVMNQSLSFTVLVQLYCLIDGYFHLYLMYVIFSISAIMLFLVVYLFLPEGRGEFLTALQMKFKEGGSSCDGSNVEKNISEMR